MVCREESGAARKGVSDVYWGGDLSFPLSNKSKDFCPHLC